VAVSERMDLTARSANRLRAAPAVSQRMLTIEYSVFFSGRQMDEGRLVRQSQRSGSWLTTSSRPLPIPGTSQMLLPGRTSYRTVGATGMETEGNADVGQRGGQSTESSEPADALVSPIGAVQIMYHPQLKWVRIGGTLGANSGHLRCELRVPAVRIPRSHIQRLYIDSPADSYKDFPCAQLLSAAERT
jgi:hypothetical protein